MKNRDDIVLLTEIIVNSIYWQDTCIRNSIKLGLIFEHITNLAEVRIVSMYHKMTLSWENGNESAFSMNDSPFG